MTGPLSGTDFVFSLPNTKPMNGGTIAGIVILIFGAITWLRGYYITRKGQKTTGTVTGFKEVRRRSGSGSYTTNEYPTVQFTDVHGQEQETYVVHLVTKLDRPEIGETMDILVFNQQVYSGHNITSPVFLYLGLIVLVVSLFF